SGPKMFTSRLQSPNFHRDGTGRTNGCERHGSPHGDVPSAGRGAERRDGNSSKAARTSYNSRHALRKNRDRSRHTGVAALSLDAGDAETGDTARLIAQLDKRM